MSVWGWYDWPLLVVVALAVWFMFWDISTRAKKLDRSLTVFLARDRSADLDYELFGPFYAQLAKDSSAARHDAIVQRVELHSVRVGEAVQA